VDWKGKLSSAKSLAAKGTRLAKDEAHHLKDLVGRATLAGRERTQAALEGCWPRVQLLFRENLKGPASGVLYNDKVMRRLLHLTYLKLPMVVAIAVEEDAFVLFCLDHRHRLLLPGEETATKAE
jgi:hypothetical protein